ncbi:hypothetical protein [Acetobacter fabarum]|uniref:hypothetical protein n=1 Tax=Acetobacter fabarum TaxID=483199 RepID=UPI0039E90820
MDGTLALWFEEKNADITSESPTPTLQLHVNLWRDLDENFNFLDLGFLLADVQNLGRLYLYLPASIERECIYDLSNALKDQDTLNAVFNDVNIIGPETDEYFTVTTVAKKQKLIHRVDVENDLDISHITNPGHPNGTVIAVKSVCCDRITDAFDQHPTASQYIRIRVFLRGDARNLFTTIDSAAGIGFSLSQDFLETTEFRLNERRSYPQTILQRAAKGELRLLSVHYFLIRSRDYQLSSQHQTFRKIRNLEDGIWAEYLDIGLTASEKIRAKPNGMIIYQWREIADSQPQKDTGHPKGMDDFIAYASFRIAKSRLYVYLAAAFAVGGVGSALCNVILALIEKQSPSSGSSWSQVINNIYTLIILITLSFVPTASSFLHRKLCDFIEKIKIKYRN